MKLLRGLKDNVGLNQGCVATIGNFDGVHLGHQALLKHLRTKAKQLNLPLLVFIFEPQPAEYFNPSSAPSRLSSLREKIERLKQAEVDYVFCLKFNQKLASMSPDEFANFMFSQFKIHYLSVGEDFRFGQGRRGDGELLKALGEKYHCEVHLFAKFLKDNARVSSTMIRQALKHGELNKACEWLGRIYHVCGRVIHGNGIGRTFGIPTANINLQRKTLPMTGVFIVKVERQNKSLLYGVANMGCRPTVDGKKFVLEIHIFNFNEMIYGERLHIFFLHKLRDEMKFSSVDELVLQIQNDIQRARTIFTEMIPQSESYD